MSSAKEVSPDPKGHEKETFITTVYSLSWSIKLCLVHFVITMAAIVAAYMYFGIGERWEHPDPDELWHTRAAVPLLFPTLIMELSFLASSADGAELSGSSSQKPVLSLHGFGDSVLTTVEYLLKLFTGVFIGYFSGGPMHTDRFSATGSRPVYFVRFAQWSVGVPVLILIANRAFVMDIGQRALLLRSAPGMALAFAYVWASWLALVTTDRSVQWILLFISFLGSFFVAVDQAILALERPQVSQWKLKIGMVAYQIGICVLYGATFMLGRFGWISSAVEQGIYAYSDVTIKVLHGAILAMIRNREDLITIRHWWLTAAERHEDLQRLIQKANVPIIEMDPQGKIIGWNETISGLTGMGGDDVIGRSLLDLVHKSSREAAAAAMELLRGGEETSSIREMCMLRSPSHELYASNPDDPTLLLLVKFVRQQSTHGVPERVVVIGQDLTDIVTLKAVEEKKARFMAVVSHELRSPLHGMIGLSGMMLQCEADGGKKRQLTMIRSCSARLLDLVTNIMDMSESEKRKQEGKERPRPQQRVNFLEIADEVLMMTRMAVDKAGKPLVNPDVALINEMHNIPIPIVLGDPYKCTQLLYNLVTNACKFTKQGKVSISAKHLKSAARLEISVSDTGRGISDAAQKRIFQPFEQEGGSDSRQFQGIGLGLAVCSDIVKLHGGDIRVQSQLGVGSTFTVSVPCEDEVIVSNLGEAAQPLVLPGSFVSGVPAAQLLPRAGGSARLERGFRPLILSVDDDDVNQEVIKRALKDDFDVAQAMDGRQALDYLASRKTAGQKLPDVILLDVQMPGMTGFEVCVQIRNSFEKSLAKLPVIMLSAKLPADLASLEGYQSGTTDYISKPFSPDVLKRRIQVALSIKAELGAVCDTAERPKALPSSGSGEPPVSEAVATTAETAAVPAAALSTAGIPGTGGPAVVGAAAGVVPGAADSGKLEARVTELEAALAEARREAEACRQRADAEAAVAEALRRERDAAVVAAARAAAPPAAPEVPAAPGQDALGGPGAAQAWPVRSAEPRSGLQGGRALWAVQPAAGMHCATGTVAAPSAPSNGDAVTALSAPLPVIMATVTSMQQALADREASIVRLSRELEAHRIAAQLVHTHLEGLHETAGGLRRLLRDAGRDGPELAWGTDKDAHRTRSFG